MSKSIKPFKGLLYSKDKVKELGLVTAPPYDVISPEFREQLLSRDEHNVVKLILPEPSEGAPDDDKYRVASSTLSDWIAEGGAYKGL